MSKNQQTISSYFSSKKRKDEPIDLTILDDSDNFDQRHTKRLKTAQAGESSGAPSSLAKKNQSSTFLENELNTQLPSLSHWAFASEKSSLLNTVSATAISPEIVPSKGISSAGSTTLRKKLLRREAALQSDSPLKDADLDEVEPEPEISKKSGRSKAKVRIGPRGVTCTPLEEVVSSGCFFEAALS